MVQFSNNNMKKYNRSNSVGQQQQPQQRECCSGSISMRILLVTIALLTVAATVYNIQHVLPITILARNNSVVRTPPPNVRTMTADADAAAVASGSQGNSSSSISISSSSKKDPSTAEEGYSTEKRAHVDKEPPPSKGDGRVAEQSRLANEIKDKKQPATKGVETPVNNNKKKRIPTVQLAGTQKASTSSVAVYLMHMAQTCFSDEERGIVDGYGKEAHFFDVKYEGGLELYQDLFRKCSKDKVLIDGTPETMMHPERVKKIYDEQGTTDEVRIIFILREPVSREISWYNHQLRYSELTDMPVWAADLYDKKGKRRNFIQMQRATVINNFENAEWRKLYGYYANWLRMWCSLFNRKQILILSYDELVQDPATLLKRIHQFLALPESKPLVLPRENTDAKKTSPPPCKNQLELAEYFKGPNEELYKFLEENPGPEMEQRPFPKFQLKCKAEPRIPSVLLAGTQMASTTSVALHVSYQGNICFSNAAAGFGGTGEQAHFFDFANRYKRGLAHYQQMFQQCDYKSLLVDGTPETMLHPDKVKKIYDEQGTASEVKIIFILREPVSRQIAWYNQQLRSSKQADPPVWAKELIKEDGSIRSFLETQRQSVVINFDLAQWEYIYGNYIHWLRLWCNLFDRKQILILSYDELVQNPASLLERVHTFLDRRIPNKEHLTIPEEDTTVKQPQPPCADQLEFASYFDGPNEELYKFLEENPGPEMEQRPFPHFQLGCRKKVQAKAHQATQ